MKGCIFGAITAPLAWLIMVFGGIMMYHAHPVLGPQRWVGFGFDYHNRPGTIIGLLFWLVANVFYATYCGFQEAKELRKYKRPVA